jgi:hypothetical protein
LRRRQADRFDSTLRNVSRDLAPRNRLGHHLLEASAIEETVEPVRRVVGEQAGTSAEQGERPARKEQHVFRRGTKDLLQMEAPPGVSQERSSFAAKVGGSRHEACMDSSDGGSQDQIEAQRPGQSRADLFEEVSQDARLVGSTCAPAREHQRTTWTNPCACGQGASWSDSVPDLGVPAATRWESTNGHPRESRCREVRRHRPGGLRTIGTRRGGCRRHCGGVDPAVC